MVSEWPIRRLADICELVDYGYTASAKEVPCGPKFLRITDIVSGWVDWSSVPYCEIDEYRVSKFRLHHGDVVIARTGATTGYSAYIADPPDSVFASYLVRLKAGQGIDSRFVSYFLKSPRFWGYMRGVLGDKSAQPNASATTMTQVTLRLPPLAEQQAIACILGTLDDKIELNRRMNETLEGTARVIFRSWFVDFDTVHAKASGQQPPRLASHLADLFPDAFEESELGKIPEGWQVRPIGEIVKAVGGGTPSTRNPAYWDNGMHCFATPKDLSRLSSPVLLDTQRRVTDAGLAKISSGLLPVGTVLLSSRAPVGYLAVAEIPVCINQGFIAMVCNGPVSHYYVLNWARVNMPAIRRYASGTTFAEISKRSFRPIPALVPSQEVMAAFDTTVEPVYAKIRLDFEESLTLAAVRDGLLPKLVSGEMRVKDAERVVGMVH